MTPRELTFTVAGLLICLFLAAIDSSIVNTALPRIASELHGFELYPWVTTGYLLSTTAVVPVAGKLGDRYGRRRLLVGGVIFFLIVTASCGFAQDMSQLIALRTLQGVGGGVLMATIFGALGELLTPVARARISGLITATFSTASISGPLVGGFLTDAFSWRAVFYANVPFGILALIALWRAFPSARASSRSRKRLPIDIWGALSVTSATVLFLLALGWGGSDYAWDSAPVLGALAAAALLLVVFVSIERRALDPVVPLALFRNNVVALSALGSLLQSMASFGGALFIPLFAQGVMGVSATVSGGLLAPMIGAMLITNLATGLAVAHFGRYKVFLVVGFAVDCLGFSLLALTGLTTPYAWVIGAMIVIGTGAGFLVGTLNLAAQNGARLSEMGVVTSFAQFSRSLGNTLGSAVLGSILLIQLGPTVQLGARAAPLQNLREPLAAALHWVFLAAALLLALGVVASLFMREIPMRRRTDADRVSPTPGEPYRPSATASGVAHPR